CDQDAAFSWLAKALDLGYDRLEYVKVDPSLAGLRRIPVSSSSSSSASRADGAARGPRGAQRFARNAAGIWRGAASIAIRIASSKPLRWAATNHRPASDSLNST